MSRLVKELLEHPEEDDMCGAMVDVLAPGEVRAPVPLGRAHASEHEQPEEVFGAAAPGAGPGGAAPGGVPGEDGGPGPSCHVVGATGGRAPAPIDGRVRDALQVELGAGGDHGRDAHAVLATLLGADVEQGADDDDGRWQGFGYRRGVGGLRGGPHCGRGGEGEGEAG